MLEQLLTPVLERNYGGFDHWKSRPRDDEIVFVALKQISNLWKFSPDFAKKLTKVSTQLVDRVPYNYNRDLFWKVVILHQQAEKYFAFERDTSFSIGGQDRFSRLRSHILAHLGSLYKKAFQDSGDYRYLEKQFVAYEDASQDAKDSDRKHAKETLRIAAVAAKKLYANSGEDHWKEKSFDCFDKAKEYSFFGSEYRANMAEEAGSAARTLYINTGELHWAEKAFGLFQEVRIYDQSYALGSLPFSSYFVAESAHTLLDGERNPERRAVQFPTVVEGYQTFLDGEKKGNWGTHEEVAQGFLDRFAN